LSCGIPAERAQSRSGAKAGACDRDPCEYARNDRALSPGRSRRAYKEAIDKAAPRYACNGAGFRSPRNPGRNSPLCRRSNKVSSLISSFDISIANVETGKLVAYASASSGATTIIPIRGRSPSSSRGAMQGAGGVGRGAIKSIRLDWPFGPSGSAWRNDRSTPLPGWLHKLAISRCPNRLFCASSRLS